MFDKQRSPRPAEPPAANQPGDIKRDDSRRPSFGLRHVLSLLVAIAVTVLIITFREELSEFDDLAYWGAFMAMLVGNATVIFPVPGLMVVFALGGTLDPLLVALAAAPGAALGELTGYFAGYSGSSLAQKRAGYHAVEQWMVRYGLFTVAAMAAIPPNPAFDMAGIAAGVMRLKWWKFLLAALAGKTIQALLVAYAGALALRWAEQFVA
jgi:membrane protein YqaA with SNARE-associated domain